ncbi:hypothetical protein Scep_004160 [Stephania cephalantha]|uniref:Uncharacterized protein n=1 Tax=Stephania cephalantha TaxID=152367 RepID=A0AAP0PYS8_9MAGN
MVTGGVEESCRGRGMVGTRREGYGEARSGRWMGRNRKTREDLKEVDEEKPEDEGDEGEHKKERGLDAWDSPSLTLEPDLGFRVSVGVEAFFLGDQSFLSPHTF